MSSSGIDIITIDVDFICPEGDFEGSAEAVFDPEIDVTSYVVQCPECGSYAEERIDRGW